MLPRILEPEVMDSAEEACDYNSMDHAQVNRAFVADLVAFWQPKGKILDVGTGTALIPIELCRQAREPNVVAIDAAHHMLKVGQTNVFEAGLAARIELEVCDAKKMPYPDRSFDAVISNSIVHHIPDPFDVLKEIVRVVTVGGAIFIRDLLRPADDTTVIRLVKTCTGDTNAHQQKMFAESLRAALTLEEIRAMIERLGFDPSAVRQTSDRHWTWREKRKK